MTNKNMQRVKDNKYWEDYEIQNPDGSWTTVAKLLSKQRQEIKKEVEGMKKSKVNITNLKIRIAGMPDLQCWGIGYDDALKDILEKL